MRSQIVLHCDVAPDDTCVVTVGNSGNINISNRNGDETLGVEIVLDKESALLLRNFLNEQLKDAE